VSAKWNKPKVRLPFLRLPIVCYDISNTCFLWFSMVMVPVEVAAAAADQEHIHGTDRIEAFSWSM
jgi:hypothetical protein